MTETVGGAGAGTFIQSGGTNTASTLTLGATAGSTSSYSLSAGTLSTTGTEIIGNSGSGATFVQSGGTNTVGTFMDIGELAGSSGIYTMSGGTLAAGTGIAAGRSGGGTFVGTNSVITAATDICRRGKAPGSTGQFHAE